jgi:hypothetical protein
VFVNTKVSVNKTCKHEVAVEEGRAQRTKGSKRVALQCVCSTRIRQVSALSEGHCSQSYRRLQMVMGLRTHADCTTLFKLCLEPLQIILRARQKTCLQTGNVISP